MNRSEFGILVASLRHDLGWTQKDLAKNSGVDIAVISSIERGQKRTLTRDNILVLLADGLRLTSMERMEFMFAASGVTENEKFRRAEDDQKRSFDTPAFLKKAGEQIARIKLPVLISDQFCDIVLVNHCLIGFYGFPAELVQSADTFIGGYNRMRYVFDPHSDLPEPFADDNFEKQAILNVRYFRRRTMRVRAKPYFTELLKELLDSNRHPAFERYWRKILFENVDETATEHEDHPNSDFSFTMYESLFALTPFGELYMQQFLPTNRQTAERIHAISNQVGERYDLFAPFPDERKQ